MKKELRVKKVSVLKVCFCTELQLGENRGAADRITNFAKSASKNQVDVFLVDRSTSKSFSAFFRDSDNYYEVKDGILKKRLYPLNVVLFFPGIVKFLQEGANKIFSFFTRMPASEIYLFRAFDPYLLVKLLFVCKKEKINLIQCEFPLTTVFSSYIMKKLFNIPIIYDAHNIESERMRGDKNIGALGISMTRRLEIVVCRLCDALLVVSEKDKDQLLAWKIPNSKITVIPNSTDITKFSPCIQGTKIRQKYGLNDKIVIIFHGALRYPPNAEAIEILENNVLPEIHKNYPSTRLLLVGGDPPETHISSTIATGYVENLPEYIAAATIAVVPLLKGGGTRIKILEYMACGKAVVSTVKGAEGLRLQNGVDIFMTELPGSEFINLVLRLLQDTDLRRKMEINARKKVELLYDWEKNAKRAVQIYRSLIDKNISDPTKALPLAFSIRSS